ncbi:MAG TPA: CHAD domain-containing protein [Rubrobacteraceae bacterium]|nr:CHAD domain-containing protein [Rubrobacteraceae bacterium]
MQEQTLDHQEIEWQFDATDLESVEGWLEERPFAYGLRVAPAETKKVTDAYYDTEDWRFYRAGYALRVRRDGERVEATMKSLAPPDDGGLKRRREISEPLESGGLKSLKKARGPVGERLRLLLAGSRDLRRLFEVRTRRRVFELRPGGEPAEPDGLSGGVVVGPEGDIRRKEGSEESSLSAEEVRVDALGGIRRRERGAVLAEVSLDESEFSGGEGEARLSRVEVEISDEGAEPYDEVAGFVEGMRGSLELRPTDRSKFGVGLSAAGLAPAVAPDLGPTEVDGSMPAGEVAFSVLRRHFATMLAHEPGVRLGEDPEELHDMRVATRRLRAALKLYREVLPKRAERYERDLRFFAGALGEVRDLDVHLERLAAEASRNWEALDEVFAALGERRAEARRGMLEVLDSDRYERFVASFSGTLRRGRSPAPAGPILEVAPGLVRRRHKKVRKAVEALAGDSPPEDFHDLRKKGKRLRYALEPLRGIYGKPAERMVQLLKDVQDDLGDHQDLIVAAELMRELGVSGDLPPRVAFSLGAMAERYAREAAEIRANFLGSGLLRALEGGKPWKRLRKAIRKKAGGK